MEFIRHPPSYVMLAPFLSVSFDVAVFVRKHLFPSVSIENEKSTQEPKQFTFSFFCHNTNCHSCTIAWNRLIFSSLHLGSSSVATAGWLWIIYHYCFPLMDDLLDFRYIHVPWWIWSSSCLQLEKQGLICFVWALVWKDVTVNCCSEAMLKKW